ncbi:MAG: cell division protein ZapA [Flavobacteriales bacterium]|nr:cell division protein ZapA [Flavobacteriales bacterium]
MSEGVSIKVNIAGKEYPLKVSATERDDVIAIEQEIKENLDELKSNYGVLDKQDLLAMFLLQHMMSNKNNKNNYSEDAEDSLHDKLKDLEDFVSKYLKS